MLQFPTFKQAEIANWLQIKIHEVKPNLDQGESNEYGKFVEEIRIVAPQSVIENNIANYTSTDFKLSSAIAGIGSGAGWLETLKGAGRIALSEALSGVGAEAGRITSQIVNPRSEQFFTGPGFRQFTFHWELAPLSGEDAGNLKNIYKIIRRASYPTYVDTTSVLYGMPNEFKLAFVGADGGGSMSLQDPKFGKCVVTNISLNYTGAGINAVNNGGGSPPFVNMDITFAERILNHQSSEPII